MGEKRYTID